ncbi:hypothetical protein MKQ70_13900 [Chitinophaga sedimenti]|uniref:hypothetical protein n=1 Tax=Chitinophaga sedimenti TaxID=2033606 RepID=UPI002004B112|nr:hypothetical protein [Chitinophaga sedimenti]MCK7556053.1 hypothetical protein [Chitinophaga sedimenti]
MLHAKPPGFSPTYDVVHVTFYMVEMTVCMLMAVIFAQLKMSTIRGGALIFIGILTLIFRGALVYYLYLWTDPEYHWVPFIYKKANELSPLMRGLFVPLQLLAAVGLMWSAFRNRKKGVMPPIVHNELQ